MEKVWHPEERDRARERDQKGNARRTTGQETLVRERSAPERTGKAIFYKAYTEAPSTHLADKRELAFPYVVTIQPKGEHSS